MMKYIYLFVMLSCLFACSRPTYYQTNIKAYTAMQNGDYKTALAEIEKNSYLNSSFNKQLYLLEKGKLLQLTGDNEQAAKLLNEADELAEGWDLLKIRTANGLINLTKKTISEKTSFNLSGNYVSETNLPTQLFKSPRKKKYRSEHYERMMINFTKAISFINLGKKDEALVEAKRLLLLSQQLNDLQHAESNYVEYVSDPFPELFAGMMYEWVEDYSNAFISYENAYKMYMKNGIKQVYGLEVPAQLKLDILKLSYKLGYKDKLESYQNLFGMNYNSSNNYAELILFFEDGYVPTRDEEAKYFLFDTIRNYVIDNTNSGYGSRLFLPTYVRHYNERNISLDYNQLQSQVATTIRNNNYVVMNTLTSRAAKESNKMTLDFMRAVEKNKTHNAQHLDTRNWQSIPAKISYYRVSLQEGENTITINNAPYQNFSIKVNGLKGLQIKHIRVSK